MSDITFIEELYNTITKRQSDDPKHSYTAKLFARGRPKISQKVGEEAVEVVIDAVADNKKNVISESADLMYHLLVLWADMGIALDDITDELKKRKKEKK